MKLSQFIQILQKEHNGKIIIINFGAFYIAIGKDAILLNKLLNLKLSCMERDICKVGFPIASIEKYTNMLIQKQYSFIVFNINKEKEKLLIYKDYQGAFENEINDLNANCLNCKNYKNINDDKYKIILERYLKAEK